MALKSHPFSQMSTAVKGIFTMRRGLALAALVLLQFCLVVNSSWKATPDSALYLELGESLAQGAGYVFNGEPHTYVPPGYPAMVAGAATILGEGFHTYRILMAMLGFLTAVAGFLLILRLAGRDAALLAGGLFAINHTLLYNSTFTTSDVPFALLTLVALNAAITAAKTDRRVLWTILAGLVAGLPALIRVNGLGVPPAIALFLLAAWGDDCRWVHRIALATLFVLIALVPVTVWELYKASFPSSFYEGTYLNAVSGRTLATQIAIIARSSWDYAQETSYALTGVVLKTGFLELVAPGVALAGMIVAFIRGERLLVPLGLIQFGGLVLAPAGSRYIILLLPGLYLFLGLGVLMLSGWFAKKSSRDVNPVRSRQILVACFAALAILNVGHNFITILQSRSALEANGAESERDLPFFTAARWLRSHSPGGAVLTMHPRVIHYLSGRPTVELARSGVPEHKAWVHAQEQIQRLILDRKPKFFFSDATNMKLFDEVTRATKALNLRLEEVVEARSSSRFRLWRILNQL